MNGVRGWVVSAIALMLLGGSALGSGWNMDDNNRNSDNNGAWVKLGRVTATHTADHDTIRVDGRNDDFRKLKFRVSDSPLNLHRIIVTYDNGGSERLDVRENIPKGGETRDIDLQGGTRSIRTIEFWYDTQGLFNGKADVTAYGRR